MAQETRIAPLELNNDASKIMMDLGDNLSKQNIQRSQLAAERAKMMYEMEKERQNKLFEVQKESSGYITSLKLSPEEYDKAIGLMNVYVKDAIKNKTSDYNSLQSNIYKGLQKINMHGAKLASLDTQVEDFYSRLSNEDKLNFDKKALLEDVKRSGLYGEVDGQLVQKSTEEINTDQSYVTNIMSGSGAAKYWNGAAGLDELNKMFKDDTRSVSESAKVRDQNGLVRTINDKSVKFNKLFQRQDDDGNVIVNVDANGMLAYDSYSQLISNPKINKAFDGMAEKFVKDYNSIKPSQRAAFLKVNGLETDDVTKDTMLPARLEPETMTDFGNVYETLKRSFATNYIQRNLGNTENTVKGTQIVTNNIGSNQPAIPSDAKPYHPTTIQFALENGDTNFIGAPTSINVAGKSLNVVDVTSTYSGYDAYKLEGIGKKAYESIMYDKTNNKVYVRSSASGQYRPMDIKKLTNDIISTNEFGYKVDPKTFRSYEKPKNTNGSWADRQNKP